MRPGKASIGHVRVSNVHGSWVSENLLGEEERRNTILDVKKIGIRT